MTDQHGVVPRGIQAAVDRVMQGGIGEGAATLQQQVLAEHEVAFVGGIQNLRAGSPYFSIRQARRRPECELRSYHFLLCSMTRGCSRECVAVGSLNGLVEVGNDVANVLDAHRKPHQLGSNAGGGLLLD